MLKKLQNLLFEDEDDDEEEDEGEQTAEVSVKPEPEQPKPQPQPVPEPSPAPAVQQTIQRIDVEKPASPENKPEPKKQTLGITVDDEPARPQKREEIRKPSRKPEVKKADKPKPQASYEFKPVISPIFGVDEKDVNALKTTNQRITRQEREKDRQDANITPIISPMYGPEASSSGTRNMVDSSVDLPDDLDDDKLPSDDLPDFSLDDILQSRDKEFSKEKEESDKKQDAPVFPDLEDEPLPDVAKDEGKNEDNDDSFFPDLKFDDDDIDTTSVIEKPDLNKPSRK